MANGPFNSYAPPGVYTETKADRQLSGPPTGLQIPVFIGTGKETLRQSDFELARGSSSAVDQLINEENVSSRFIVDETNPDDPKLGEADGLATKFKVKNLPIVIGDGQGLVTNRPQDIDVTVDGVPVVVAAVDGEEGVVTLQVPPPQGAEVRVTYYFNRTDTLRVDDVSEQVSDDPAVLKASEAGPYNIVNGSNDILNLVVDGVEQEIDLQAGSARSASDVAIDINGQDIDGLTASADVDNQGQTRLQLSSEGSLEILVGSANSLFGFSSGQKTDRNRSFYVYQTSIVDGTDGGITTTDPEDITVEVNGDKVQPDEVEGKTGRIVLPDAPVVGSTVTVEYYFNTFQDTFDYLPNKGIEQVERVGNAPGRKDYIQGQDFVIEDDRILWGSGTKIEAGQFTASGDNEPLDDELVSVSLKDEKKYLEEVERKTNRSVSPPRPSNKVVLLGDVPTDGSGRDNPTSDVNKVSIYHGRSLSSAVSRGEVTVTNVDPQEREVTVEDPIPADHKVFATYWYNRLRDDTYTIRKTQSGEVTISSDLRGENLYNVRFGTSNATDTIKWPSGVESNPDAFVVGTDGVNETVTITFQEVGAKPASFTSIEADPYDIFANASDQFGVETNDGDRGISNDSVDVSLDQSAFAVLVSDRLEEGGSFSVTSGENDTFEFQHDGNTYSVTMASGTYTIQELAEFIWRVVPNETEIKGTATESFDLSTTQDFDITINGTNAASTISGTSSESASSVESKLESEIESVTPLVAGDITDPSNDFDVIANSDGTVSIVGSESLSVNNSSGQANDPLEVTLGWDSADVPNDDGISTYTLGNTLENTKIARTWEAGSDGDYILLRSRTTPAVPSDTSSFRVLSGNANDLLGFEDFETAEGTVSAVNEGATLLSDEITSAMISNIASQEPDFVLSIDGDQYTVPGSNFNSATTVGDLQTAIDNEIGSGGAGVATVTTETIDSSDHLRITSNDTTSDSAVEIGSSDANQYLGYSEGETAGQRRPTAGDVVAVLNNSATGWSNNAAGTVNLGSLVGSGDLLYAAYAEEVEQSGAGGFLNLTTFGVGSDVSFTFVDTTDTVFNDTGIGIEIGDSAVGVDGEDGFSVSSSAGSSGSSGTGFVGQTYTDDTTGLRFTVLDAEDGNYQTGDSFDLVVEEQMETGSSLSNKAIAGVETFISDISDVAVNDSSIVTTYDKSGEEPDVGDFYYITYDYLKEDFSTQLFTRFREVQANYGELSPDNPLTLASYLALLNGASLVAAKQVKKEPGSEQATSQAYIDAINDLKKPIQPGIEPDLIVPLTTDSQVMAATVKHCEIQSSPRHRNERRAIFGVASGTRPQDAAELADNLGSERAVLVYPDSALISLTNELGEVTTYIVDGSFVAAALAGNVVSPANDVATPMTRQRLVGFDRFNRSLDEVEMNRLATKGVTVLRNRDPFLEVRQGLTTNTSNRLTSTPSIIAIKDFVQQQARSTLERFIGLKFLTSRAQDVESALTGLLNSLVENNIIVSFQGVSAEPDPNDPTVLRVSAFYSPVYPLLYIPIEFTISASGGGQ